MILIPKEVKVVAVDTETSGLYPDEGAYVASVAVAWRGGSLAMPFGHQEGEDPDNLSTAKYKQLLNELSKRSLVFHNANFDLAMLAAGPQGRDLTDYLVWDTMLAHRILYPTSSASLDNASQQVGLKGKQGLDAVAQYLKENKLKKYRYDLAPWEIVREYVTADAELTWQLYEAQLVIARDGEVTNSCTEEIQREIDLCEVLTKMEIRGIGYDKNRSIEIAKTLTRKAAKLEASMPFGCGINEAKEYFFDVKRMAPDRTTEGGKPSLDKEQVRDWAIAGVPYAQEYKEVVWARRAVSRWYQGYADKIGLDGRLRVRYRQGSVVSGRLSAERINLQALPLSDKIEASVPGPRELMQAEHGSELWSLDMSQAELRIGAKYAQCERLIKMLDSGIDYHAVTTEKVLGVTPDDPDWKNKRVIGKKLNFGSLYGIGPETFQRLLAREAGMHISARESREAVYGWRDFWPEFVRASRRAESVFDSRGWVRILMDSEHETRSYKQPQDFAHTGFNRMVQGSLAGWMRLWLVEIEAMFPGALVLTVHDSAVLELPKIMVKPAVKKIKELGSARASKIFGVDMPIDAERV